ncbi:CAP domain-containing protein [Blakeslea trispora]|nr:CAP domain-containing protein [Blakeslea trispora]
MLFIKAVAVLAIAQVALAAPHQSKSQTSVSKHHGHTKHNTHHANVHHKKATKTSSPKKSTKKTSAKKPVKKTSTKKPTNKSSKKVVQAASLSSIVDDDFAQAALDRHNKYRAIHHVSPLKWSEKLAADAMKVAKTCIFQHQIVDNEGQCLAMGYPTINDAVKGWYDEVDKYDYNKPDFSMATGHFTQVVWKGTTEVGCASNSCPGKGGNYIVCNYNPSGNYLGQFAQNVFAP